MYYKTFWISCQLLFAGTCVAFKQHSAEEVDAPCLEQSDLFESKQLGHEPVPQPHGRQGHDQTQCNQEGNGCDDGSEDLHLVFLTWYGL
jgi:hypothetical protein